MSKLLFSPLIHPLTGQYPGMGNPIPDCPLECYNRLPFSVIPDSIISDSVIPDSVMPNSVIPDSCFACYNRFRYTRFPAPSLSTVTRGEGGMEGIRQGMRAITNPFGRAHFLPTNVTFCSSLADHRFYDITAQRTQEIGTESPMLFL